MAALNFPEALADGQTFEADTGVVYVYQGNPPTGFWSATSTKDGQQNQDARYVQITGDKMTGDLKLGGTGADSDFITFTAQNGNAEFKGEVTLTNGQISTRLSDGRLTVGDYNSEASTAIYKGNISIAKDADTCLDIYGGYNLASPNISLRADGTGDFSKNINVSGSARIGGLQAASAATTGVDVLSTGVVYATASNGPVFVGQTQGTNVSTSQIDAAGTAQFANDGVVIGSYLGGDLVVQGDQSAGYTYLTRTRAQGYANVGDSTPTWYLDNASGVSGFDGFMAVGDLVYNGGNGVNFYPEGRIDVRRADEGDVVWAGYSPTSYTSLIRGNGTAEFVRGTTQVGTHSYTGGADTTSFINTGFLRLPVPSDYAGPSGSGGWVSFAVTDTSGATTSQIQGDGSAAFLGNVGIGTNGPTEKLEIEGSANADGSNPTKPPETLLRMRRPGTASISYPSGVDFRLSRYANEATNAKTQFDINLINGPSSVPDVTVMTLRSDRSVAIAFSTNVVPSTKLEVNGDIGIGRSAGAYTFREVPGGGERAGMHSNAANELIFKINGAQECARFDTGAGRFLIGSSTALTWYGVTTPQLQVAGTTQSESSALFANYYSGGSPANLILASSKGGSVGVQAAVTDGSGIGQLRFIGSDGSEFAEAATIQGLVDGNVSSGSVPGRLVFKTTQEGGVSPLTRMTIYENGNATFTGSVQVGGDPDNGANLGTKALNTGTFLVTNTGTTPVWAAYKQGSGASTSNINADGSAAFCKAVDRGIFLDPGGSFTPTIRLNASSVSNPGGGSKAIIFQYDGSETGFIRYNGSAVFNLESDDPNQYTTTTDADGNEVTVYNGPTLDVKDRLVKTKAALEAIKAAAEDTNTDLAGLKSAIVTALSDI